MARGHRLKISIVLAAVHGLSGLFRTVSAVEPSLCRPLPALSLSLISHLASVDVKQQQSLPTVAAPSVSSWTCGIACWRTSVADMLHNVVVVWPCLNVDHGLKGTYDLCLVHSRVFKELGWHIKHLDQAKTSQLLFNLFMPVIMTTGHFWGHRRGYD